MEEEGIDNIPPLEGVEISGRELFCWGSCIITIVDWGESYDALIFNGDTLMLELLEIIFGELTELKDLGFGARSLVFNDLLDSIFI